MPFTVTTVDSEDELATLLTAVVTTVHSEDELEPVLDAAISIDRVVCKGPGFFTVIDNAQITNISLDILAKGGKFTAIVETV